jgi:hypothetical protein
VRRCGQDASGSGEGPLAGSCEHGTESLGSMKEGLCSLELVNL